MASIPLTQGQVAQIDDADIPLVEAHRWHAVRVRSTWYAATTVGGRRVYLHRLLAGPRAARIDHVDTDGLNNRRENLRDCSHQQNLCNRGKPRNNTSGFKGVCWDKSRQKWVAHCTVEGRQIHLGRFVDPVAAARAYDAAAFRYFGPFARPNFAPEKVI